MTTGAVFSEDRKYRYNLVRIWDSEKPMVAFVGLNPSTADETQDDPTIRRCIGYAKDWGYGGLLMGNIFAFRATDPKEMKAQKDPVGPDNDYWLRLIANKADKIIAAWGTHGKFMNRGQVVRSQFLDMYVLGTTKGGHPKHPLYLKKDLKPKEWKRVAST